LDTKPAKIVASLKSAVQDGTVIFAIFAIALWMMSRPFKGIGGDGRIYMTRALADLNPATIGRDMMFAYDGQSQFSIFTKLADWLVGAFNPANAAFIFALLNLAWLAAIYRFISRFMDGKSRWALIAILAVAPNAYGAFGLIHFGETIAVPRPLAEACVLFALSFLVEEKRFIALVWLILGALFHPIMALPGFGIFAIDLCWKDRRFIWLAAAGIIVASVAATIGLPLFDRLSTAVDPEWLTLLRQRNPYLFLSLWPLESFTTLALELTSLFLALRFIPNRHVRLVFLAASAIGCGGLLAAYVFGDFYPLVLVVQAQLWRATWLVAAFGALGLGICLLNLNRSTVPEQLSAMALTLGWLFSDTPLFCLCCSALALLCMKLPQNRILIRQQIIIVLWAAILITGFLSKLGTTLLFATSYLQSPPDFSSVFALLWSIDMIAVPAGVMACLWAWRSPLLTPPRLAVISIVALCVAVLFWTERTPMHRYADPAPFPKELATLLPDAKSEVLWLGDRELDPWYLAPNPNWGLFIQGAGIVFSRPLAMLWHQRIKALVDLGLAEKFLLEPWKAASNNTPVMITRASVDALCARPDAPSAIIAPREKDIAPPQDVAFQSWSGGPPHYRMEMSNGKIAWHEITGYMIIRCDMYKNVSGSL